MISAPPVCGQPAGTCSQSLLRWRPAQDSTEAEARAWMPAQAAAGVWAPAEVAAGLCTPGARGGGGWHVEKEAVMARPAPPFTCHSTTALCFYRGSGLLPHTPSVTVIPHPAPSGCLCTAYPSPLPGIFLLTPTPAPSPCPYQWMRVSGWGAEGGGLDSLCRSPSVPPAQQTNCCTFL